jgi:hypothetical protein
MLFRRGGRRAGDTPPIALTQTRKQVTQCPPTISQPKEIYQHGLGRSGKSRTGWLELGPWPMELRSKRLSVAVLNRRLEGPPQIVAPKKPAKARDGA